MSPFLPARIPGLIALLLLVLLTGCQREHRYDARGRVVGFGNDGRTVFIEHEEIDGFMPAMTMPFKTLDTGSVTPLAVGDAVGFTLHVTADSSWITALTELPDDAVDRHPAGPPPAISSGARAALAAGDPVPDFTLLDTKGEPWTPPHEEGRAWLVTFIYTRCPLPDFCPLMTQRFRAMQPRIEERFGKRVRLVSITIDPEYDTPEVLATYAEQSGADPARWSFLTGTPEEVERAASAFGVYAEDAQDGLLHSLATALVTPDGRVAHVWRGNDWTVEDVLEETAEVLPPLGR